MGTTRVALVQGRRASYAEIYRSVYEVRERRAEQLVQQRHAGRRQAGHRQPTAGREAVFPLPVFNQQRRNGIGAGQSV